MDSKAFAFFNTIYRYFQVSFYFWVNLLKGAIIYSLIPAFSALLLTIKELHNENEEQEKHVKGIFSKHFNTLNKYKFVSFIYSIIVITSFSSLYLLNRSASSYALLITILIIYMLVMTVLLFTYTIFYLGNNQDLGMKQVMVISFVAMIRKFGKSAMVLIFIIVLLFLAYYNFLLFIIVAPFLYGISINGTLQSLLDKK